MYKMYINNEEVVCNSQIEIVEEMLSTSSTILNNCYPASWEKTKDYVNNFYYPEDYSKFKIIDTNSDNLIFCGVVKNTGDISLNPRYPHFCSLQILDFKTFLSEGDTLDFVINDKTIEEAINMVVEKVSDYGFEIGIINVFNKDEKIGAYSTLNKSAYDVLQYLADISQSKWFTRVIDENTIAIDFYDPVNMPRSANIKYNDIYFENNKIKNISFSYGSYDYRNKQIMLSDEVFADIDYTEEINTDGYSKTFILSQKVGVLKNISVNGVIKTIATKEDKELGIVADFYWSSGSNQIETDNSYTSGSVVTIMYTPIVKGRQTIINNDEVQRVNSLTNRKGVIARYETRNDALSSDELNKIGQTYLRYKGISETTLKIENEDVNLFSIGDVVYFEAPIEELKQEYMVKKVTTKMIIYGEESKIFFTYELSNSFNSESDINYFDNQRQKANGNIQAGDYIDRNIDIENQALITFYDVSYNEVELPNNNVLQAVLGAPFIK